MHWSKYNIQYYVYTIIFHSSSLFRTLSTFAVVSKSNFEKSLHFLTKFDGSLLFSKASKFSKCFWRFSLIFLKDSVKLFKIVNRIILNDMKDNKFNWNNLKARIKLFLSTFPIAFSIFATLWASFTLSSSAFFEVSVHSKMKTSQNLILILNNRTCIIKYSKNVLFC